VWHGVNRLNKSFIVSPHQKDNIILAKGMGYGNLDMEDLAWRSLFGGLRTIQKKYAIRSGPWAIGPGLLRQHFYCEQQTPATPPPKHGTQIN